MSLKTKLAVPCGSCKFWYKDPEEENMGEDEGRCLRTFILSDEQLDESSLSVAEYTMHIPRILEDEKHDPIGTFIDGTPYEDLLARRVTNSFDKIEVHTWMITRSTFACNQSQRKSAKCDEYCVHCQFSVLYLDNDEKESS